jgi:hypothetical protein
LYPLLPLGGAKARDGIRGTPFPLIFFPLILFSPLPPDLIFFFLILEKREEDRKRKGGGGSSFFSIIREKKEDLSY